MKVTNNEMHPMESMVADYLNGHLSPAHKRTFDEQLARDEQLRALVGFERRLQRSMRNAREAATDEYDSQALQTTRQWNAFADRIRSTPQKRWFGFGSLPTRWLVAGPAMAAVLMVMLMVNLQTGTVAVNEFDTVTDPETQVRFAPVLRIIGLDKTTQEDLAGLLTDYQLSAITRHPQTQAVDVALDPQIDVADLTRRLQQDDRVRLVRIKEATQ